MAVANDIINLCRFVATSAGTGSFVESSAAQGYQGSVAAGAVNGNTYSYRAESDDLSQWEYGVATYSSTGPTFARTTIIGNSSGTTSAINFTAAPKVAVVELAQDMRNPALLTGFLQAGTGAVARPWQDKVREIFSAKDFGAVGDGSTNDHAALQAAVDAIVAAGGGILYLPTSSGEYINNSTLSINTSALSGRFNGAITIRGDGPNKSCIKSTSISSALVSYTGALAHDESYFRIENIRLTGNTSTPVASSVGLSLNAGAWMTFERVYIEGFDTGFTAVDVDQVGWYNCNIRYNNKGFTVSPASTVTSANSWSFFNCLVAGNSTYGGYVKNANSFNYIGGSIQGNGRIGGGSGQFGLELEECGDGYGSVLFEGTAFESNGGTADFVSLQTTNPASFVFNSVAFLRSVPAITSVTGAANNGSGLIRLTTPTALYTTGQTVFVGAVGGVPNATGQWVITVIDSTHIDLQSSTFSGTYTSGGIVTYLGYATNNVSINGSNANAFYRFAGCQFRTLSPYVASASRLNIALYSTVAKVVDDGSNYYQNSSEAPTYPDSQLISLGARNGVWTQTAPSITTTGTAGSFAGSVVMRTLQIGKLVHVQAVVTISNIGTATGFKVAYPVTPKQTTVIVGSGDSASVYSWRSDTGQIFRSDASGTPQAQSYNFSDSYEAA